MEKTIARIPLNRVQDIRVRLIEYPSSLRVYINLFVGEDDVPMARGISMPPSLLPDLIEALQKAEAEVGKQGLDREKERAA